MIREVNKEVIENKTKEQKRRKEEDKMTSLEIVKGLSEERLAELLTQTKENYKRLAGDFNLNRTISLDVVDLYNFREVLEELIIDKQMFEIMVYDTIYKGGWYTKEMALEVVHSYLEQSGLEYITKSDYEVFIEEVMFNQSFNFAVAITVLQEFYAKKDMAVLLLGLFIQPHITRDTFERCSVLIDLVALGLKECVEVLRVKVS